MANVPYEPLNRERAAQLTRDCGTDTIVIAIDLVRGSDVNEALRRIKVQRDKLSTIAAMLEYDIKKGVFE